MEPLNMDNLVNCFESAIKKESKFVGVAVALPDTSEVEIIINGTANFRAKLNYYLKAYNADLTHKHAADVKILGFTYGNSFASIEYDLLVG